MTREQAIESVKMYRELYWTAKKNGDLKMAKLYVEMAADAIHRYTADEDEAKRVIRAARKYSFVHHWIAKALLFLFPSLRNQ